MNTTTPEHRADTPVRQGASYRVEIFDSKGKVRALETFSDEEVASLTPEQLALAKTLVEAKARVTELETSIKQAKDILIDMQQSRANFSTRYAKRFAMSFMDVWKLDLKSRHDNVQQWKIDQLRQRKEARAAEEAKTEQARHDQSTAT